MENPTWAMLRYGCRASKTEVELVLQLHDLGHRGGAAKLGGAPHGAPAPAKTINTYERHADPKHCRNVQDVHSHSVSTHGASLRIRSTLIISSGEVRYYRRGREHDVNAWRSYQTAPGNKAS